MEEQRDTPVDVEERVDNKDPLQDHISTKSGETKACERRAEMLDIIHERVAPTQAEKDRVDENYLRGDAYVIARNDPESYVSSALEIDDMLLVKRETGTLNKFNGVDENAFPKASDVG